ncbi:MAG: serine protease spb1 [Bdellovibrio sp.]|jgi:hypothetical protein
MNGPLIALVLLTLLSPSALLAAACCGSNFAIPSLIAGDERAQVTTSLSNSSTDRDVSATGEWTHRSTAELSQTFKIEAAHIFADRWQGSLSVPVLSRERSGQRSSGLADVQMGVGYEILPDWDYHPYRPKGILFSSVTVPTGQSSFEAEDLDGLEARGQGFWALGAGLLLTKTVHRWDFNSSLEIHHSFNKNVSRSDFEGRLEPGWGGTFGIGAGFNQGDLRIGTSLSSAYEDPIASRGTISSDGSLKRFTTTTLMASYLFQEVWAATVSFSDQSWFGSPINTPLAQTAMLQLQRRWSR